MADGHGGRRPGAGRKPGSANRKTRELADQAAMEGITQLEVQLQTMRMLWMKAHEGSLPDLDLAKQACAIAAQAAPYCHPRLAAVEAKLATIGQVEVQMTGAELAEQSRRMIREAFREYQPPGVVPARWEAAGQAER